MICFMYAIITQCCEKDKYGTIKMFHVKHLF